MIASKTSMPTLALAYFGAPGLREVCSLQAAPAFWMAAILPKYVMVCSAPKSGRLLNGFVKESI